ncbi:hypothetical protein [Nonomuraea sp. NPDC049784]|uniref:hypothetical protein n=1 Tax=Nonomuraea sp. NPDC049784 TaxID=3154361 RepID=UPI0033F69F0F
MANKIFAAIVLTVGLGFALAGTANATTQAVLTKPSGSDASVMNLWYKHSSWSNQRACELTGQDLRARGEIIDYYCSHVGVGTGYDYWILYVYVD